MTVNLSASASIMGMNAADERGDSWSSTTGGPLPARRTMTRRSPLATKRCSIVPAPPLTRLSP